MRLVPDAPAGKIVGGRYEILRVLGQGAFGRTFLARDTGNDRPVAIKLLDARDAATWKAREMFEREADVLRSLRHHGIPEVFDLVHDDWNGSPALMLVMEYIEGVSVAHMIEERRALDPADVVHWFLELLGILEHLHGRVPPILHRDIKPSNIIIRPDGIPALVDFGSVRRVYMGPDEMGSTVAGTFGYMPYEQYMGRATPASDLYALGATFLHLLTGRGPRDFMTDEGRLEVPESLPGDRRLRPLIARLLEPSPADRFASAADVRHALLDAPAAAIMLAPRPSRAVSAEPSLARDDPPRGLAVPEAGTLLMGPAPRELTRSLRDLLDWAAPSMFDFMDSSAKPGDEPGVVDWLSFLFFSAITAGVLPMVFYGISSARRRRVRRFLREGVLATGEILSIAQESTAFGEKVARVSYQFEADGRRRDADRVHPGIAHRWQPGDLVYVLYIEREDYDSVIISTR